MQVSHHPIGGILPLLQIEWSLLVELSPHGLHQFLQRGQLSNCTLYSAKISSSHLGMGPYIIGFPHHLGSLIEW